MDEEKIMSIDELKAENILTDDELSEVAGGKKRKYVKYKVVHGDTLTRIAHHYKTTIDAIMRLNPIIKDKNFIVSGWTLTIPDNR